MSIFVIFLIHNAQSSVEFDLNFICNINNYFNHKSVFTIGYCKSNWQIIYRLIRGSCTFEIKKKTMSESKVRKKLQSNSVVYSNVIFPL